MVLTIVNIFTESKLLIFEEKIKVKEEGFSAVQFVDYLKEQEVILLDATMLFNFVME